MKTRSTILAVDDSSDILAMISGLLKDRYQVKAANCGEKALLIAASAPPDLILLDIMMPGLDGYEVCKRMKADPMIRDIPVIFLTAKSESEDEIKGFELGAVDYITKPISPSKLLARVKTHLLLKETSDFLRDKNEFLERRVAERTAEVQEVNSRFVQVAQCNRTVIWEVDAHWRYTYISDMSETVYGYRPDEVIGRMHFQDMLPESERAAIMKTASTIFKQKNNFENFEHSSMPANAKRNIWVLTNGVSVLDADGSLLGYRGSDTDITESKTLRQQLIQSQKMESVGQLAGGLAHDFNNVLTIISGYSGLLHNTLAKDDRRKEYVQKVITASSRAAELTHSLLAFSRTQVMNLQNLNLNSIVNTVGIFVKRIIGEHIQCQTVVQDTPLIVHVDVGQIEQVLINLCNNARDAMPDGGKLTIATDVIPVDAAFAAANHLWKPIPHAVISVSDTGKGMDEETRLKIFEPFFTTKEVGKGTGLGLAMVYGIVKQHNGVIDVISEPGKGARFLIYLPIVESEMIAPSLNLPLSLEATSGFETILVVEDDAELLEFLHEMLTKRGYQTILAVDGQDAIDKYKEHADKIQLIVMDMVMPRKSGTKAYDEIRQIRPEAKVLFCSGYSTKAIEQREEYGNNSEISNKPVHPAVFLKKIREMLDR